MMKGLGTQNRVLGCYSISRIMQSLWDLNPTPNSIVDNSELAAQSYSEWEAKIPSSV